MARIMGSLVERMAHQRALRRWKRAANEAARMNLKQLRAYRADAHQLRRHLERMMHVADDRLSMPMIGTNAFNKPIGADWAWRPELWRMPVSPPGITAVEARTMLGEETSVFHDCSAPELIVRQVRNSSPDDLAPFGLQMDVFRFDGSFLSIVIDLPGDMVAGLKKRHVISVLPSIETEKPLEIFARLNIKHGPNTEQVIRNVVVNDEAEKSVEFDLAYTELNEKRVESAWLDFIFDDPRMNQIFLRDVTLARRPRAEI